MGHRRKPKWKHKVQRNILTDQEEIAFYFALAVYWGEGGYNEYKLESRLISFRLVRQGIHPRTGESFI